MHRIPLSNTAFEGDNNVYLFVGAEITLVDAGDWLPATRDQLEGALESHGVTFGDVDRIVLTHWHMDHTGLAGAIQAESDAEVYVHEADAPLVGGDHAAWRAMRDLQEEYFEQWGMPAGEREGLRDRAVDHRETGRAPEVTTVTDGDAISLGDGRRLTARHASGHADGSCWFEIDAGTADADTNPEIIAGDVLLPEYTPNVGGADVRVEKPLEEYVHALETVADADYARAWPGHRDPIADPTARAEEILTHHEERAYRVLDALDRLGPSDAWTISADLFGDLADIHVLHGPGEAYAHLDHLERAGTVTRTGTEYRVADGVADRLETLPDERWPLRDDDTATGPD